MPERRLVTGDRRPSRVDGSSSRSTSSGTGLGGGISKFGVDLGLVGGLDSSA